MPVIDTIIKSGARYLLLAGLLVAGLGACTPGLKLDPVLPPDPDTVPRDSVNLIKVPFHILVWGTISWQTFLIDLAALPGIALGFWIGVKIIKLIPEREFRYFIIVMTLLAAIRLLY